MSLQKPVLGLFAAAIHEKGDKIKERKQESKEKLQWAFKN